MINKENVLEKSKNITEIRPEEVAIFCDSVPEAIRLSYAGNRGLSKLRKIVRKQMPFLSKLANVTLHTCIGNNEMETLGKAYEALKTQINAENFSSFCMSIPKLYETVFGYSTDEIQEFGRLGKELEKKARRKFWIVAGSIGGAVATAAATIFAIQRWGTKK